MNIAIFAGGVGTRLCLFLEKVLQSSLKNPRRTFYSSVDSKKTLPDFKPENIYIATGKRYKGIIEPHVNEIPKENFIFEPEMRDVGPAVGLQWL